MSASQTTKVLAVDDSRVALLSIKRMLQDTEFELVGQARSAAEALELHSSLKPDVALVDIVMPDATGVELLEQLRQADPNATVVMASSLGTKEKVTECTQKGAASFLMKPYERADLLRVLRSVTTGESP